MEDKVRTIYGITLTEVDDLLNIDFHGNGFLYNIVRILVGTLQQVGGGRIAVSEIPNIIASKDRHRTGVTAPAHGLTLMKVEYPTNKLSG